MAASEMDPQGAPESDSEAMASAMDDRLNDRGEPVLRMARDDHYDAIVFSSQTAKSKRQYARNKSTKPKEVSITPFLTLSTQILVPGAHVHDEQILGIAYHIAYGYHSNAYNHRLRVSSTTLWPKKLWSLFDRGFVVNQPLRSQCAPKRSTPK